MIKSSSESVKAIIMPLMMPGIIEGQYDLSEERLSGSAAGNPAPRKVFYPFDAAFGSTVKG